jgi:hypothetical protein
VTEASDLAIFWAVVAARFFIPLAIPRYPLPAVVTALILDGVDQTIFQLYTNLPLDNYQGYDKALDIYYLTIAYVSTIRNWLSADAFNVSRFLFYYRLVGVTLFELTQFRPLLLVFPNTFEYFFIFYEVVRLRWDPTRLKMRHLIGAAAFIWIFIKLPQEYIIHVAQVDVTDWLKINVFRVPTDVSIFEALISSPLILAALAIIVALLFFAIVWLLRRLPAADWNLSFSADAHLALSSSASGGSDNASHSERIFSMALVEKIVLVSLVTIIFSQILPGVRATNTQIIIGVAVIIIINSALSHGLVRLGIRWGAMIVEFLVMAIVNFVLILVTALLLPTYNGTINLVNGMFFALLLTLIVTMLDRYKQLRLSRPVGRI